MAQAISRSFKDISLSFQKNPITNDLIALKNATAISRSIRNLIFTQLGERFFSPNLGSRIGGSLFELLDYGSASAIETEIKITLDNYEPRVELIDVQAIPNFDNNQFAAVVTYKIIGINIPPQELQFVLQPTR